MRFRRLVVLTLFFALNAVASEVVKVKAAMGLHRCEGWSSSDPLKCTYVVPTEGLIEILLTKKEDFLFPGCDMLEGEHKFTEVQDGRTFNGIVTVTKWGPCREKGYMVTTKVTSIKGDDFGSSTYDLLGGVVVTELNQLNKTWWSGTNIMDGYISHRAEIIVGPANADF